MRPSRGTCCAPHNWMGKKSAADEYEKSHECEFKWHLLLLVEWHRVSFRSTRIDRRCSYQVCQVRSTHDDFIGERTEPGHFWLSVHGDAKQSTLERIDNDEHITKLGRKDVASIIAMMLTPNDVNFIVSQVTGLRQHWLGGVGGHSRWHVENYFDEWRRIVGRCLSAACRI